VAKAEVAMKRNSIGHKRKETKLTPGERETFLEISSKKYCRERFLDGCSI
jgi:hypothetical protein